ncbi:unnamed protein product, partial [Ilex paraguariensis]
MKEIALERYKKMKGNAPERLVSGFDDFTMFLWEPAVSKHPKTRMTGHQQAIQPTQPSLVDLGPKLEHKLMGLGIGDWGLGIRLGLSHDMYARAAFGLGTSSLRMARSGLCLGQYEVCRFLKLMWPGFTLAQPMGTHAIKKLVNHVYFSPDGQWRASASFDKSVKLWNGITEKFVATFRGHVGPVYQIRLLLSESKDSTLKVWDIRMQKLKQDLPGHADEVFTVDWSPYGEKVASGGKDR